jgi:hypothetical protein
MGVAQAQSPALKTWHDEAYGVTFRYPAQWTSGPEIGFYLGSEILDYDSDGGAKEPLAKVGFVVGPEAGPYSGTNLNGVQFVFNVIPHSTGDQCRKSVEEVANLPLVQTILHGIAYDHYSGGDAGLGHQASREIYSTFRDGHCYLFEESIHTVSINEEPLSSLQVKRFRSQLKQLQNQLDKVMQSVRFEPAQ